MTERFEFDHLSIGVRRPMEAGRMLRRVFGAEPLTGGISADFSYILFHLGDVTDGTPRGQRLELISTPPKAETGGFMGRFLARRGDAAHHLSFNVPDILRTRRDLHKTGFVSVQEDLDFPKWQELFLPPDELHGIVIQIASTPVPIRTEELYGHRYRDWDTLPSNRGATQPGWWEELWDVDVPPHPEVMTNVVLGSQDVNRSDALFRELLGGRLDPRYTNASERSFVWPTGRLTVVEGDPGIRSVSLAHSSAQTVDLGDVSFAPSLEELT